MNVMNDIKLGYGWVRQSYDLFLHHPAKWLFLSFLYLFVFILMPMLLLGTIGFLVNQHASVLLLIVTSLLGLAFSFSWPIFTSIVIGVCRETHMNRQTSVSEIFAKIRPHIRQLVFLGIIFFSYRMIMLVAMQSDIQALEQWRQAHPNVTDFPWIFWITMLKVLVLEVPLILATWYSPLLISFQELSVIQAIQHSIWASLKNLVSLISAWVSLTIFVVILMLVLGLLVGVIALLSASMGKVLGEMVLMLAFLVATAFLFSIQYFSYLYMYYEKNKQAA